ncbi:hypothetical protein [Paenibacillus donghaensis]|uniref:hypothetical protein n=1 Tax=Paenibacillus donghaensis TaxID=414771 RepID=UPI0012FD5AE8|nr:hypothetical protein [Paenibacillus donghaensis]
MAGGARRGFRRSMWLEAQNVAGSALDEQEMRRDELPEQIDAKLQLNSAGSPANG